jgi:hypothetical protein
MNREIMVSLVISWSFLERLPLQTIMTKDDRGHMLALDQVQEFACAGAQLLLVLKRPGLSIRGKFELFTPVTDYSPPLLSLLTSKLLHSANICSANFFPCYSSVSSTARGSTSEA